MFDLTKPFRILKKNLNQKLFFSIAKFSDILKYRMITSHAALKICTMPHMELILN